METKEIISSAQNPKVKLLLQLQQKSSERRKHGMFVVEGQREVLHCLSAGYEVVSLFFCPQIADGDALEQIQRLSPSSKCFEISSDIY